MGLGKRTGLGVALRAPHPWEPCPGYSGQLATPQPSGLRAPVSRLPPRLREAECSLSSGAAPTLGPDRAPAHSPRLEPESGPGRPKAVPLEGLLEAISASSGLCWCRQPRLVAPSAQSLRPVVSPGPSHSRGRAVGLGPTRSRATSPELHLPRPRFQTRSCGHELGCPCSARSSRTCSWPTAALTTPPAPRAHGVLHRSYSGVPGPQGPGHWALDPAGALMRMLSTEGPL